MRLVVLTTDTLHHTWFVQAVRPFCFELSVISERRSVTPPYATGHGFEQERDAYERDRWFGGRDVGIDTVADVMWCEDINDGAVLRHLTAFRPDLVVSFGTGLIREPLIGALREPLLNLHGGDPERYRGLDTHLWAIWHRDFDGLVTTLHTVAPELDTGDIVAQASIPLTSDMRLAELRAANSEVCLDLVVATMGNCERLGKLLCRRQTRRGRYYSFMPADLKTVCKKRFETHTRKSRL